MLSDILCDEYHQLKRGWEQYQKDYSKDQNEEVEDILERMNALLWKLDSPDFIGSYRFEDGGHYQAHKLAFLEYRQKIFDAAGDLNEEWEDKEEAYEYLHWDAEQERWALAMSKLKAKGKSKWAMKLKERIFNELHEKLFGK